MTAIVIEGRTVVVPKSWLEFRVNGALYKRLEFDGPIYRDETGRWMKTWAA